MTLAGCEPLVLETGRWRIIYHRPSLREYLRYEAEWAGLVGVFLPLFRGVGFLTVEEVEDRTLHARFVRELATAIRDEVFLRSLTRFLRRWTRRGKRGIIEWPRGLSWRNAVDTLTLSQVAEVCAHLHLLVLAEKKNTSGLVAEAVSRLGSTCSATDTAGPSPRYGTPTR